MNASTITTSSFTLTPSGGSPVAATVAYNGATNVATLTPSASLAGGTTYTAKLDTTITASDGIALASAVTWQFTTTSGSAPTVTSVTPPNGQTGVNRTYHPTATFSVAMDATTITTSSFTLKDPAGTQVAATVSYSSATLTATITPNTSLQSLTTYTARLMTTIKSAAGVPLASVYSWNFQTSSPKVTSTYPTNGSKFLAMTAGNPNALPPLTGPVTEISPWTPIEVGFSEPMDPLTITPTSLVLLNSSGGTVGANVSYDSVNNVAVLIPNTLLSYGKTYTVQVATTILAALDGAPLAAGVTWNFTVTTNGASVGINAGTPPLAYYSDASQTIFLPDQAFTGGTARTNGNTFAGTTDQALYQYERVGMSSYTLLIPAGIYDLKLFFAETEFNAPNQRVFNVDIPETTASPDLHMDIYNEVGANTADVKTISGITTAPGPNISGYIHINFTPIVGQPVISAIELIPIRPTVTVKSPASGATGVARTAAVKATFSQSMDGATITPLTFTLTAPGGVPVAATVSYSAQSMVATLNPSASLAANTTYTVLLDSSIKSLAGLRLGTPVTWTFTTGSK